jgi:hypothetical protein
MHLITQSIHVLPSSNSATKSFIGAYRIPRYCSANLHCVVFQCWDQIFRIVGFLPWVVPKREFRDQRDPITLF